jgi:hypothetical protein
MSLICPLRSGRQRRGSWLEKDEEEDGDEDKDEEEKGEEETRPRGERIKVLLIATSFSRFQ